MSPDVRVSVIESLMTISCIVFGRPLLTSLGACDTGHEEEHHWNREHLGNPSIACTVSFPPSLRSSSRCGRGWPVVLRDAEGSIADAMRRRMQVIEMTRRVGCRALCRVASTVKSATMYRIGRPLGLSTYTWQVVAKPAPLTRPPRWASWATGAIRHGRFCDR